jgi:hypothetical protein
MVIFDNVNLERINIKINVEQIPNINPNAKNLFSSGDAFGNKAGKLPILTKNVAHVYQIIIVKCTITIPKSKIHKV